jgi:hypothetical protein
VLIHVGTNTRTFIRVKSSIFWDLTPGSTFQLTRFRRNIPSACLQPTHIHTWLLFLTCCQICTSGHVQGRHLFILFLPSIGSFCSLIDSVGIYELSCSFLSLHASFLLGLFFDSEDGYMFLRNFGCVLTDYTALYKTSLHNYRRDDIKHYVLIIFC